MSDLSVAIPGEEEALPVRKSSSALISLIRKEIAFLVRSIMRKKPRGGEICEAFFASRNNLDSEDRERVEERRKLDLQNQKRG